MSTTIQSERLTQRCPGCGRMLRIPPELKGEELACKFCDHPVTVGAAEPSSGAAQASQHGGGLSHVGTGTAFQMERTWTAGPDTELRYTVMRHPSRQPLRGYTLAVECFGPARVHLAGIKAADGQAIAMGKLSPQEARVVPLDDLFHVYLWLEKGATSTVKMIVARGS